VAGLLLVDPTAPGQTALLRAEMPGAAAMLEASMAGQLPMVRREFEAAERAEAFSAARAPYRAGPVIVLAAQKKDMISSEAYWTQRQRKLEELAAGAGGVLTPVESGHFIQREAPEAVLAAADQLLSKLRV
jgi:pimeloyl-ACP methyl ester carboxylesterase